MADDVPDLPGVEDVHGMFYCGTCGWEDDGFEGEYHDCPYCVDAGGFSEPMSFEPDGPDDYDGWADSWDD